MLNRRRQVWVMLPLCFVFLPALLILYLFSLLPHLHPCGVIGNICHSGSVGLPHSAGRAHFLWGTVLHSHNDGKYKGLCVGWWVHSLKRINFNQMIGTLTFSLPSTSSFRTGKCWSHCLWEPSTG